MKVSPVPGLVAGVTLALGLAFLTPTNAVAQAFKAGENYVGPSVSLATYGSTAAIGGNFEHAVNDKWGWGIAAQYFSYSTSGFGFKYSTKYVSLAGTAAYHFEVEGNEKLDPFVGAALGYNIVSIDCPLAACDGDAFKSSGLLFGGFGGVRYWVKDNLAITGRTGYGLGYLSAGVDFKF